MGGPAKAKKYKKVGFKKDGGERRDGPLGKKPKTFEEFLPLFEELLDEWEQWGAWVAEDIHELEVHCKANLAPPPPPPDPW